MFKSLFLLGSSLSVFTTPIQTKVVEENGIKITYKYETNEVNSVDDLIVGNVYTLNCENLSASDMYITDLYILPINRFSYRFTGIDEAYSDIYTGEYPVEFFHITESGSCELQFNVTVDGDFYLVLDNVSFISDIDFVFLEYNEQYGVSIDSRLLDFISRCENVPIESVERVYPQNIFGNVSEFIDEYLLSGIPLIDSVNNNINGVNVTLRAWLNTTICISLAVILLILLLLFIRWLFKLFAGLLSR